jgi:membrane-bound lytic murein transglycosylase MltF
MVNDKLSWHTHIDQMIPKLNKATYVIRVLKSLLSMESLKTVYFSLVHSVISYGIIFRSSSTRPKIIFKIKKRIIRIIMNFGIMDSC